MQDISHRQLKDKAIVLKGKNYVQVVDRIRFFNENYPKGSITTDVVQILPGTNATYVVKATIDTGEGQKFCGHSQATMGTKGANMEAALENAETSAVGRALGMMCIGVIDSVASIDEMKKAKVDGTEDININDIF
jgi:hypothetical protein